MTNFTESTWALIPANEATRKLMKTYLDYPPRPLQSEGYSGPITLTQYFRFANVREELEKQGFSLPMPSGN
jgi:arylsulfatase